MIASEQLRNHVGLIFHKIRNRIAPEMGYEPRSRDELTALRMRFEAIANAIKDVENRMASESIPAVEVQTGTVVNVYLTRLEDWSLKIGMEANRSIRESLFARQKKAEFDAEQAVLAKHREDQSRSTVDKPGQSQQKKRKRGA